MAISDTGRAIKQETGSMVNDIADEVQHEVHNIRYVKEPVDPTHTDQVVRRHVNGLVITFFVAIALFLAAAIAGIAIYQHGHRAAPTPQPPTSSLSLETRTHAA